MTPVFRSGIVRIVRRPAAVLLAVILIVALSSSTPGANTSLLTLTPSAPGTNTLLLTLPLSAPGTDVPAETLNRRGMTIELFVDFGEFQLSREEIVAWIDVAVDGLHAYYGRLPIDRVKLRIESFAGRGVGSGTTFGNPSPRIELKLGTRTEMSDLMDDWKMTHEFLHLTIPKLSRSQTWLDEGIATYVEPLARFKVGNVDEEEVWKWLVKGVPNALDESIEGGLDDTRRWGTIYWGGALFCLLADIDIRQATGNRKGLRAALTSLVERGRVIGESGRAVDLFREADKAVGVSTLSVLYTRLRLRPFEVDTAKLFKDLGVALIDGAIVFDDDAPMAGIRRAITRN